MSFSPWTDSGAPARAATRWRPERAVLLSTYALIMSGALLLSLGARSLFVPAFAGLCCAAHAIAIGYRQDRYLPALPAGALAALALAFGIAENLLARTDVIYCMAHFLVCVQVLKLFQRRTRRGLALVQVIAVFEIVIGGSTTDAVLFLPLAALCCFVLVWSHMSGQLYLEEGPGGSPTRPVGEVAPVQAAAAQLVWLCGSTAALYLCTAFIFVLLPRFWTIDFIPYGNRAPRVGYSDDISLNQVGKLHGNEALVMKVKLTGRPGEVAAALSENGILMRGQAFQVYRDGRWLDYRTLPEGTYEQTARAQRSQTGFSEPSYYLAGSLPRVGLSQAIVLEPIGSKVLFTLYRPVPPEKRTGPRIHFDRATQALMIEEPRAGPVSYEVVAVRPLFTPDILERAGVVKPERSEPFYLEVPEEIRPELLAVKEEIERHYSPDSDYQTVMAVMDYLKDPSRFSYTSGFPYAGKEDPAVGFLTESRSGNCEHFATAMSLLLRLWGMPTRFVAGFRDGDYDEKEDVYVFRQKHAHTWLEVCFNNYGWVELDPTPAASEMSVMPPTSGWGTIGELLRRVVAVFRNANMFLQALWQRKVLSYDSAAQKKALLGASALAERSAEKVRAAFGALTSAAGTNVLLLLVLFACLAALATLAYAVARWMRKIWGAPRGRPLRPGLEFYANLLKVLARKGVGKPKHLTPREFAAQAARALQPETEDGAAAAEALYAVTDMFCLARFGARPLSPAQMERISEAIRTIARCKARR